MKGFLQYLISMILVQGICFAQSSEQTILNWQQQIRRRQIFETDTRQWCLKLANRDTSLSELATAASKLSSAWSDESPNESAKMLMGIGIPLLERSQVNDEVWRMAMEYVKRAYQKLPDADIVTSDRLLMHIHECLQMAVGNASTLGEIMDRTLVTDTLLQHANRVDKYVNGEAIDKRYDLYAWPKVPEQVPQFESQPIQPIIDPVLQAQYAENIELWKAGTLAQNAQTHFRSPGLNRWPKLQEDISRFVQMRYSTLPEDLDILEAAFNKHIKNPELREKLILKCFKGSNPFLGRHSQTEGKASGAVTSNLRGRLENQMRPSTGRGTSGTLDNSGSNAPTGAQTAVGILTTPKGIAGGLGALGLGTVLFILWRARTRGRQP